MKRLTLRQALRDNRGISSTIMTLLITMVLFLIFSVVMENQRLHTLALQVDQAMEAAIISVCADNFDEGYNGLREGYSGGYVLDGSWRENISTGDIYAYLDQRLGTHNQGDGHVKASGDGILYKISSLDIAIQNAPLAPGTGSEEQFTGTAHFTLTIPMATGWSLLPPTVMRQEVTAGFSCKF